MTALDLPALFALAAAVLAALAICAPARAPAAPPVSFAPPPYVPPSPPVERWAPPPRVDDVFVEDEPPRHDPSWTGLIDPRAAGCDAATRCALADALATVRAPWADAIIERALRDEDDAIVIAALRRERVTSP